LILPLSGYAPVVLAGLQLSAPLSFAATDASLKVLAPIWHVPGLAVSEKLKPTPHVTVPAFGAFRAATVGVTVPSPASGGVSDPVNDRPWQVPTVFTPEGTVVVVVLVVVVLVVVVLVVVVVVATGVFGNVNVTNAWSVVGPALFDDTRSWQFVQLPSGGAGLTGGSVGPLQANCRLGCRPFIGSNSCAPGDVNVAVPFGLVATTGAFDAPLSQSVVGSQPCAVLGFPSHCSTKIVCPGVKPVATTVNDNGFPLASPGTTNVVPDG
jgi:hypothetical protein